jgi:hypothetical protein
LINGQRSLPVSHLSAVVWRRETVVAARSGVRFLETERSNVMSAERNIQTAKQMYEAFGRGDLQAILDRVTLQIRRSGAAVGGGCRRSACPFCTPLPAPRGYCPALRMHVLGYPAQTAEWTRKS